MAIVYLLLAVLAFVGSVGVLSGKQGWHAHVTFIIALAMLIQAFTGVYR